MNEKQFIAAMQRDGWQALNASGDPVERPRIADRLWVHSETQKRFEGGSVAFSNGKGVVHWQRFAEAGQTPPPF